MSTWWDLPGPQSFVTRLAEDLRTDRSALVLLPRHAPRDLERGVRHAMERWLWYTLRDGGGESPVELVYRRCLPEAATARRTPYSLAQEEGLEACVIWVELASAEAWPRWRRFLTSYGEVVRGRAETAPRFVVALRPGHDDDEAATEHYRVRRWQRVVRHHDLVFFAARARGGGEVSDLMDRLAYELVARLAGYDLEAAGRLARLPFEELHAPQHALRMLARERGWPEGEAARQLLAAPAWHEGMADASDGSGRPHPALLAAAGRDDELQRCIWSAQVATVFPFMEEVRRDLLTRLRPLFRLPHRYEAGHETRYATELYDLEIGHIHHQLQREGGGGPHLLALVAALREARNDLAHLRPVSPSRLRSPAFIDPGGILCRAGP